MRSSQMEINCNLDLYIYKACQKADTQIIHSISSCIWNALDFIPHRPRRHVFLT